MKVKQANIVILILLGICYLLPTESLAQDSIPPLPEVDTTRVDTIVIRAQLYKIKNIPRGVNLTVPKLTFTGTKPLTERQTKFKIPSFWTKENQFTLNLSEAAFVNWNAGGENSISALGGLITAYFSGSILEYDMV